MRKAEQEPNSSSLSGTTSKTELGQPTASSMCKLADMTTILRSIAHSDWLGKLVNFQHTWPASSPPPTECAGHPYMGHVCALSRFLALTTL